MGIVDPNQSAEKLIHMKAEVEGWKGRTVRLDNGKCPLTTVTYNYNQCEDTKGELARRIAALWNMSVGMSTDELERLAQGGARLRSKAVSN
ncbi:hypothetical protein ACI77O_12415 [Pseudomonas tritici]|uniref:hypothetical protein n=1 Tax=Pseudomonas tritici TaxID=2745518 RepID=UPI00387B20EE